MRADTHIRSIVKTLSWRVVSIITTFTITYFFTKSAAFAISISLTDTLIKFLLFYVHERSWFLVKWGTTPIRSANTKREEGSVR